MNLFPKADKFFDLFEDQTEKLNRASKLLRELRDDPQKIEEVAFKMRELEREADHVGYQIIDGLHRSFITPIDRSDIDILRQNLDDIMDGIEKAINRMFIYGIPFTPDPIGKYFMIIEEEISEIERGVRDVRNLKKFAKNLSERCYKINILEDNGDTVNRDALEELMHPKEMSFHKTLDIIKRKEVYDILEGVVDHCEDVGNVLESILIKNL